MDKSLLEVDAGLVIDKLLSEIAILNKDKAVLSSQVETLLTLVQDLKDEMNAINDTQKQ